MQYLSYDIFAFVCADKSPICQESDLILLKSRCQLMCNLFVFKIYKWIITFVWHDLFLDYVTSASLSAASC